MKGKETDHLFLKTQHEKASGISRNCAHKLKLWQLTTCDLHIPSSSSDSWGPFSIRLGSFRQLLYCLIMHNWSFQMTTEAVTKAHGSSCNIMQNVLLTAKTKISDEIMGVKGQKITIAPLCTCLTFLINYVKLWIITILVHEANHLPNTHGMIL